MLVRTTNQQGNLFYVKQERRRLIKNYLSMVRLRLGVHWLPLGRYNNRLLLFLTYCFRNKVFSKMDAESAKQWFEIKVGYKAIEKKQFLKTRE